VRAAARKGAARAVGDEAVAIADGVYHVARETLEGVPRGELPLPVFAFAPLVYATEMMASVLCRRHGLEARQDEVARYLFAGVQEVMVAAFGGFDPEHFEAWTAAAVARDRSDG
jgi:hypothetical protein